MLQTTSGTIYHEYKGNYGVNWGSFSYVDQFDQSGGDPALTNLNPTNAIDHYRAPFATAFGAKLGQITDGTSSTLLMLEMIQAPSDASGGVDRRARIWNHIGGTYQISAHRQPNSSEGDISLCQNRPEIGLPCSTSNPGSENLASLAARSDHSGGVNVVLCDGSSRFVTNDIDIRAWKAASTMNGEETFKLTN
jgi:prepilin-type processing-associated H-X9-DG protein